MSTCKLITFISSKGHSPVPGDNCKEVCEKTINTKATS